MITIEKQKIVPVLELVWGLGELLTSDGVRSILPYLALLLQASSPNDSSDGRYLQMTLQRSSQWGVVFDCQNTVDNYVPFSLECVIFILP